MLMWSAAALLFLSSIDSPRSDLVTTAESSGYETTGRSAEAERLCGAFEAHFPGRARCFRFGTSAEERAMWALALSDDGVLTSEAARGMGRPVIVVQAGIHAGEIDGKDAGFETLRDALAGVTAKGSLRAVTVVFIPILNVDGHERFGPCRRANQRGPRECGWRVTAQNLNLNRDYAKAETPEMQALLRLLNSWDPILYVDLHVTDGAKFRHDVAVMVDPGETPGHPLRETARALRDEVLSRLEAAGHAPLGFYPSFRKDDDPTSGFAVGVATPRLSTPYWALRDRLAMLVETHSWKTYPERVRATRSVLVAVLEIARDKALAWREATRRAEEVSGHLGGKEVVLDWKSSDETTLIDFQGYAWDKGPSAVSGATRIRYDETTPEIWKVPFAASVVPTLATRAPKAGWIIPPAYAAFVRAKLEVHGFRTVAVESDRVGIPVAVWRASAVEFGARPYEGRMTAKARGAWVSAVRDIPAGSLVVPIDQPGARLLVHLLEPEAPDSLVSWGFFNAVFEQKEYMEDYVAEEIGEEMLRTDPALKGRFETLLETDPAFARDPGRRLEFFYRRHPSWDERKDEYPIVRIDSPL